MTKPDLMDYSTLPECTSDELSSYFETFKIEAFRLELKQSYSVSEERDGYSAFMSGRRYDFRSQIESWCNKIRGKRSNGAAFRRVRLIEMPLSDYVRYEILTGYQYTVEAGDDIKVLVNEAEFIKLLWPAYEDFWLFDSERCVLMIYDESGDIKSFRKVPQTAISQFNQLRDKTLEAASRLTESPVWRDLVSHVT